MTKRDLTRRTATGADAGDMSFEWDTRRAEPDAPRDCVTEIPLHGGHTILLLSWDVDGKPGPTSSFPADEVEDRDHVYLLDRCRAIYRKTHPPHLKVG